MLALWRCPVLEILCRHLYEAIRSCGVKYWEIIADNLSKAGWSLGWVSAVDSQGRTIWIADAPRGDGKRYVTGPQEAADISCLFRARARCSGAQPDELRHLIAVVRA